MTRFDLSNVPSRFSATGLCSQCFRGDHIDPPAICGECEATIEENERRAEHQAREHELDFAFHDMVDAMNGDDFQKAAAE